jgi:hypothetical protein
MERSARLLTVLLGLAALVLSACGAASVIGTAADFTSTIVSVSLEPLSGPTAVP